MLQYAKFLKKNFNRNAVKITIFIENIENPAYSQTLAYLQISFVTQHLHKNGSIAWRPKSQCLFRISCVYECQQSCGRTDKIQPRSNNIYAENQESGFILFWLFVICICVI